MSKESTAGAPCPRCGLRMAFMAQHKPHCDAKFAAIDPDSAVRARKAAADAALTQRIEEAAVAQKIRIERREQGIRRRRASR